MKNAARNVEAAPVVREVICPECKSPVAVVVLHGDNIPRIGWHRVACTVAGIGRQVYVSCMAGSWKPVPAAVLP